MRESSERFINFSPALCDTMIVRFLFVDDQQLSQLAAVALLQQLGHEADAVSSGMAAIAAVRSKAYDIIVLDLEMPTLDGYQTARMLRSMTRGGAQLRIVALTAHDGQSIAESCARAGIDASVQKPLQRTSVGVLLGGAASLRVQDEVAVLDAGVIRELSDLRDDAGRSMLPDLVERYVAELPGRLQLMSESFARGDLDALRRHAHSLRSTSLTLGALEVSRVAQPLEASKGLVSERFTEHMSALASATTRAAERLQHCVTAMA